MKPMNSRLRPLIQSCSGKWIAAFSLSAVAGTCALGIPRAVQSVMDQIKPGADFEKIRFWLAAFVLLAACSAAFKYFAGLSFSGLSKKLGEEIQNKIAGILICDSSPKEENSGVNQTLLASLTQDVRAVMDFVESGLSRISATFWLYGLGIVFLAALDWKYVPVVLAAMSVSALISLKWHSWLERLYHRERQWFGEFQSRTAQGSQELESIKSRGREEAVSKEFESASQGHLSGTLAAATASAGLLPLVMILWGIAAAAFIAIGAAGFRAGNLSVGEVVASFQYLAFFSMPTLDLCYGGDLWRKARVAWSEISKVLERDQNESLPEDIVTLNRESRFFARPLIENLLLIDPLPSLEEIEEAMRAACLIGEHQDSLGAWLDRDPNTFSSGEKKRAALARLFLMKNVRHWKLHQPFEGLNSEIAEKLFKNLEQFKKGRTLEIISGEIRKHV